MDAVIVVEQTPIWEVFAQAIQPIQFRDVLPLGQRTEEGIERERKSFQYWLQNQWAYGMRYENQLVAWLDYVLISDNDWEDEDDIMTDWMGDISAIFESQASVGNYNEFGGQG